MAKSPLTEQERAARKAAARIREKKRVRKEIMVSSVILSIMFAAMILYVCFYAAKYKQELFDNDYNGREEILLAKNLRGKIYAADATNGTRNILAESVDNGDGTATRIYPYGNLFAHVVGYIPKGGSGLEQLYNYDLVHTDITLSEKSGYDAAGIKYPGNDVYTTLDTRVQEAAYKALGHYNGAVIVSQPSTGRILAMVSKPDFDPGTIEADWDTLLADSASGTFVNRASQGLYAPGSTFKIFDSIALMNEGMDKAENYSYDCEGYTTIEGEIINCYQWTVHGHEDLTKSFAKSCNASFVTLGMNLDRAAWNNTLSQLMFNEKLPFDLPSEVSTYTLDDSTPIKEVLQLAIGQGQTLMTPLHLNMVTEAIANGGTAHKPYLVDSVQSVTGKVLSSNTATAYKTLFSPEIASKMRQMMRAVVEEGTAEKLSERSYYACGKTGSAEFITGDRNSHAWFTGFASKSASDEPQVCVTVVMEGAGTGGGSAVPVARYILDVFFGLPGSEDDIESEYSTWTPIESTVSIADPQLNEDGTVEGLGEEERPENVVEMTLDTNGDGIMDGIDVNGDGIPEAVDMDGDGIPETHIVDGVVPAFNLTDKNSSQQETSNPAGGTDTGNSAGEAAQTPAAAPAAAAPAAQTAAPQAPASQTPASTAPASQAPAAATTAPSSTGTSQSNAPAPGDGGLTASQQAEQDALFLEIEQQNGQ